MDVRGIGSLTGDNSPYVLVDGVPMDLNDINPSDVKSISVLKSIMDLMALYKMNVLHLHLTDDQGWRVEVKKYPELTKKGAHFPDKYKESQDKDGYYTQGDIKELVAYGQDKNITIIPEIEMPGHSLAVLACYPDLSCIGMGDSFEIHPFFKGPGIHEEIFLCWS